MDNCDRPDKNDFLYPRFPYRGSFDAKFLIFNANLQEFNQKIGYISGLHSSGKLSSCEAYERIQRLWKELKRSKKNLLDEGSLE